MKIYNVYFMLEGDGFSIDIQPDNEAAGIAYLELLTCFGDIEDSYLKVSTEQQATDEFKSIFSNFVEKYKNIFPILNRLNSKIENLSCDEYFLVLPSAPVGTAERLSLEKYISTLNEVGFTVEFQKVFEDKINLLYKSSGYFISKYDWSAPRSDRKIVIGNPKKEDRCCRFCNQTIKNGATFKKVAHAIPEGLGNKNIILGDECDECNEFFGNNIESSLIEYLDVYRVLIGIKGKGGNPKIKSSNGSMQFKENMLLIESKNIEMVTDNEITAYLEITKKLVPVNIYKALCKITLSTIDEKYIADLNKTIKWMMNDDKQELHLPKVAVNFIHNDFSNNPKVVNYVRKVDDSDIPHIISEFRIGSFVYVYIIPFSEKDVIDFIEDEDYEKFWQTFKQYSSINNWSFECFSKVTEVTINEKISADFK